MVKTSHILARDLRGASRLAVDGVLGVTGLVENLHHNILRGPAILGQATQRPTQGITGLVYRVIRAVTGAVGGGIDSVLRPVAGFLDRDGATSPLRDNVLAALNGVLGDHLQASANPLAITMQWRRAGHALVLTRPALRESIPDATGKILLLVHGLCMSDLEWQRHGHDHGAALAADEGFTPVYLHYNSGLHVSSNGRELAERIEALLQAWPVAVHDVVILAHSMGGLVARSAMHIAQQAQLGWLQRLRKVVFLGTPHHGAPLERGGNWVDALLDASPYTSAFARLGKLRSAGITDLRHGSVLDADWERTDRFARTPRKPEFVALPEGVQCYAVAASIARANDAALKRALGDGLVPVASALGQHEDARRNLRFAARQRWVAHGMNHLDLLHRRDVYQRIRRWLRA